MKRILLACALLFTMQAVSFAAPDPSTNPVFDFLQKTGAKFYYLGRANDLDGWFIIKDGQVQILYATPDNKAALIGALISGNGDNVTVGQVTELAARNKEVGDLIAPGQKQQQAAFSGQPIGSPVQSGMPPLVQIPSMPTTAPSTSPTTSPGERLMHDLASASSVTLGTNTSAPEILMIMDPNCPHCQATWKLLRDLVMKGSLQLRLIPIGTSEGDSERAAAMLISSTNPLDAWDKYVAGDKSKLAGTPGAAPLTGVRANHMLIDGWKIDRTPYLVYRSKDGKVKIVEGELTALAAVLTDLGL
jgi:thiol:disulfide interchange protein DsbG